MHYRSKGLEPHNGPVGYFRVVGLYGTLLTPLVCLFLRVSFQPPRCNYLEHNHVKLLCVHNIMLCVVGMAGSMPRSLSRSSMAKRLSPFSQHSLEHSWNSASSFGPCSTRRTIINWSECSEGLPLMDKCRSLALKGEAAGNESSFSL